MPRGFGTAQPKRGSSSQLSAQRKAELEADIEAFLQQDEQTHPEHYAQAWRAGVYNPLSSLEADARLLTAEEIDWLFLARQVGWLEVQDELSALYFTAPPPDFDPNQADWYLRPDRVTLLEAPMRLGEAMVKYPVPQEQLLQAVTRYTKQLRWKHKQVEAFIHQTVDKSKANLTSEDFVVILLELQRL